MMKILKEVFPECLMMLRKSKEGVRKTRIAIWWDAWQVGKMDRGRTSLTCESWRKAWRPPYLIQKFQTVSRRSRALLCDTLGWGGGGQCRRTVCLFYFMKFGPTYAFIWKNNFAPLKK